MSLILSLVASLARSKSFFSKSNGIVFLSWRSTLISIAGTKLPIIGIPARSLAVENETLAERAWNLSPSIVTVVTNGCAIFIAPYREILETRNLSANKFIRRPGSRAPQRSLRILCPDLPDEENLDDQASVQPNA